jgi:HflK protein
LSLILGVLAILTSIWIVLREASPYVLAGLAVAGLLHEFVDTRRITAAMGGKAWKSVFVATFLGAPLPFCSCGVLPAAVSLRRKGAGRGATIAFLVSTPETGIDSLFLSWGLLGPLFALVRAVTGLLMGILAGGVAMLRGGPETDDSLPILSATAPPPDEPGDPGDALTRRLARAMRHGFIELFGDIAFWLLLGLVASGVLVALLPEMFFARFLPNEPISFLVMAAAGAATYVCSSASTPLAAAMVAGGLNPGAALVYLLTGPATNPATLLIVGRMFGRRTVAVYLGTVFAASLGAGVLVNRFLPATAPLPQTTTPTGLLGGLVGFVSAVSLLALTVFVLRRRGIRRDIRDLIGQTRAIGRSLRRIRWRPFLWRAACVAGALVALLWLSSSFFRVRPGERAVVRLLGRVESAGIGPGLHVAAPAPFGRVELVASDAVRTAEIGFRAPPLSPAAGAPRTPPVFPGTSPSFSPGVARLPFESQFVTGDENVIEVTAVVQYRIWSAPLFLVSSERAEASVASFARALLVEEIGKLPVDAVYSSARGQVESGVLLRLRQDLENARTGLEPLGVRLLYVHAPDDVHQAFRDVASAAEDSATARNTALVESEGSVRQARAEAARSVLAAEAARLEIVERSRGAVAAFVQIQREYGRAPEATRLRLYLETAERALAPLNKWIKPAGVHGLELWISRSAAAAPNFPSSSGGKDSFPTLLIPTIPPSPQK